jgi:23S rRNA (pseudouridine1915-N3)-methyltransferase
VIRVLCVGKLSKPLFEKAVHHYTKQIQPALTWTEVEDGKDDKDIKAEGERLLSKVKETDHVVALAIEGKQMDSESFSRLVDDALTYGRGDLVFVIGGSHGLSEDVLRRADKTISFSPMTFPHQLVRVVLAEQVFRARMIAKGHPYHK